MQPNNLFQFFLISLGAKETEETHKNMLSVLEQEMNQMNEDKRALQDQLTTLMGENTASVQDGDQAVNSNDALVVELREELNKRDQLLAEKTEAIETFEKQREDFQIVYNTEKGR